jgi:hypothetical protein
MLFASRTIAEGLYIVGLRGVRGIGGDRGVTVVAERVGKGNLRRGDVGS